MINGTTISNLFIRAVLVVGFILSYQGCSTTQVTSHRFSPSDGKIATEIPVMDSSAYRLHYKQVDSIALELTVYPFSSSQSKAPAIVFFFGGGWKTGTVDQFKPHAEYFAQRGMTGILVDYRVSSRHGTTPFDAVDDAREAVTFIVRNADKLGVDKRRIVLGGGSAGGHLALMSAFQRSGSNKDQKPAALVLFNPVIDTGPGGYGYERLGDHYKTISPVDHIPEPPPPMIVFLGTGDRIVDVGQAEDFCSSVRSNNGQCILKLYKGQKHGFFNYRNAGYFIQTVREADRFLIQKQLLKGTPNIRGWMQRRNVITNQRYISYEKASSLF